MTTTENVTMSKWNYELYRRISEKYEPLFCKKAPELESRHGICITLFSVSADLRAEVDVDFDEYIKHDDGTYELTFINDHTHVFIDVTAVYTASHEKVLVKTIFDFRGSLELGDMADRIYADFEKRIDERFHKNEKEPGE